MLEDVQVNIVRETYEVTKSFANVVNRGATAQMFILYMSQEHRTLQQKITSIMLSWFAYLASLNENQYDIRNEASVRIARKIMVATNGVTNLPLI